MLISKEINKLKKIPYTLVQEENVLPFAHVNFGNNLVRVTPLGLRFQSARSATQDETQSSVQMWYQDITREKHMPWVTHLLNFSG